MPHTLEQLSADIRAALKADAGPEGKQAICTIVAKVRSEAVPARRSGG